MSESILKALINLFALISSSIQCDEVRREIVRNYLNQHLNNTLVEEYLKIYDSFLQQQESKLKEKTRLNKRFSVSSVKVLKIATQINEELTHYQKLIVTIELLEFLRSGESGISDIELEYVNTIAATFNINYEEYMSIFHFVTETYLEKETNINNLYIITGDSQKKYLPNYIYKEHFLNEIHILNVSKVNLFLVKTQISNDLTLNGQMLQPHRVYFLRPGSSLRDSRTTPITYTDISKYFTKIVQKHYLSFEAKEISYKYKNSDAELQPVSFIAESGNMVGIMGDSGAGKSTLINLLTGILKPDKGEILINGNNFNKEPEKFKGLIGYVAQDDLLIEDLTVYQNLYYNALLCFDHLSKPNIKRKVENLLKTLGLYDTRNLKVGNPLEKVISGGQRKRLNIALELIREPAVMFLDEPTSGLSSRDSENIIDLLKELSLKGKLIFVVIHQPSSQIFKMFNQLLVLDSGGYLIYDGDPVESINYFKKCVNHVDRQESECQICGNVSPEQILTIVNSNILDEYGNPTQTRKISSEEWSKTFQNIRHQDIEEEKKNDIPLPKINFTIPKRLKQFFIFTTRDVLAKLSNRQYMLINLLVSPFLALFLSSLIYYFEIKPGNSDYIFYNNPNLPMYIVMAVIIAIFIGLSVSAEEIISDRKILKRESFLHLSRLSYLSSKVFILAIISAIQTASFVIIGNSIMQIKGMALIYWIILFSSSIFANVLGLLISDTMKKTVNIYILIPFLIIPQLILSGVFVNFDQLNPRMSSPKTIPFYGELITARWAYEAIIVENYKNNEYQKYFFVYDKLKSQSIYHKDYWVQEIKNQLNRFDKSEDTKEKTNILRLVKKEIIKHNEKNLPELFFDKTDLLTPEKFDKPTYDELIRHLEKIRSFYIRLFERADNAVEEQKKELIKINGAEWLINLKNTHHNESMERFVRRSNDIFSNKITQYKDELVQKFDPIYEDPSAPFIKAQFLASSKRIGKNFYSTFNINLLIIWLLNIFLFICLYYRLLDKVLKIGSFIKLKLKF